MKYLTLVIVGLLLSWIIAGLYPFHEMWEQPVKKKAQIGLYPIERK